MNRAYSCLVCVKRCLRSERLLSAEATTMVDGATHHSDLLLRSLLYLTVSFLLKSQALMPHKNTNGRLISFSVPYITARSLESDIFSIRYELNEAGKIS